MELKVTKVELGPYDQDEIQDFILRLLKAAADRRQVLTFQDVIDAGYCTGRSGMVVAMELSMLFREGLVHPVTCGGPLRGGTIVCLIGHWPAFDVD